MTDLLRLLAAHQPADDAERRDREDMVALVERGGDPFARDRFEPGHLTASAFVLDAAEERLLLLYHTQLDRWLPPGGHGEPGETDPLRVALREAEEETGIAGLRPRPDAPRPLDLHVHPIPARIRDGLVMEPAHRHFDVRFLVLAPPGAVASISPESRGAVWRTLIEAARPGADPAFRRAVAKIRALVAG